MFISFDKITERKGKYNIMVSIYPYYNIECVDSTNNDNVSNIFIYMVYSKFEYISIII